MRTRTTAILTAALLLLGVAGCDDTVDGLQEDAEEVQDEASEALNDLQDDE